jgi:S1-C subfamily serine protease
MESQSTKSLLPNRRLPYGTDFEPLKREPQASHDTSVKDTDAVRPIYPSRRLKPARHAATRAPILCHAQQQCGAPLGYATRLLIALLVGLTALFPPPAFSESPVPFEVRRATQEIFRDVADSLRPSLVRIETVGGAQPQATIVEIEDDTPDEPPPDPPEGDPLEEHDGREAPLRQPPRRQQSPFVDRPGSAFVVADGPTTGLVYSADGYIITSSFNFAREPALISVVLADGRRLAADLIARDAVRKIALLRVDADDLIPPTWVDARDLRVGQTAIALGLGFGGDRPSVTVGIVSALERMRGNAFQTDAKLSPANYGGPVCDIHGRVMGIAVPMAQQPGELAGVDMYDAGVGFAVPKHRVDPIVATLMTGRTLQRGWLGISVNLQTVGGVAISNVADPSPMSRAGVVPGDRIVWAEGRPLKHFGHLMQTLYMIPAGEEVYLTIERDGRQFGLRVALAASEELGPLPDRPAPRFDPSNPLPRRERDPLRDLRRRR